MKFCCTRPNSSKRHKSLDRKVRSPNSSVSYTSISPSSMPRSDSGFSETASNLSASSSFEQILFFERLYHQNLKEYIIKYSRPLRRYLHPEEIVRLFQNIEKIATISESAIRQGEKALDKDDLSMYRPRSRIMIDSYDCYLSRCIGSLATLKQCEKKIAYSLQIPVELLVEEMTDFLLLPLRHICLLNELCQSSASEPSESEWAFVRDVRLLSKQAAALLRTSSCPDYTSLSEFSQDSIDASTAIVLQRIDRQPWESNCLELLDARLVLTSLDQSSVRRSIALSDVVHMEEDLVNEQLHLIVATPVITSPRCPSVQRLSVYLRFENPQIQLNWFTSLTDAIQQAKDQSWINKSEVVL